MEQGSLLQQALQPALQGSGPNDGQLLQNTLILSVYCLFPPFLDSDHHLSKQQIATPKFFLSLARECVRLNQFLQQKQQTNVDSYYPWWSGGDGPVFGIHVNDDGIPHLRAHCRYGPCVADEWKLIALLLEYTAATDDDDDNNNDRPLLAAHCWDVDDGDVLLIQSAYDLPDWVHQADNTTTDETSLCRNRCWILNGHVTLIEPTPEKEVEDESLSSDTSYTSGGGLSLIQALRRISLKSSSSMLVSSGINGAIHRAIQLHVGQAYESSLHHRHRAAVAVPRCVAHLIQKRPDLVAAACAAFAELATKQQQHLSAGLAGQGENQGREDQSCFKEGSDHVWEDWVWTTHTFGRTQFALLRNLMAAPDWMTEEAMPARYLSVQVQRLKHQAAFEATPHLKMGVQVGVRLVAGLEHLMSLREHEQTCTSNKQGTVVERRVLQYWPRILQQQQAGYDKCRGGGGGGEACKAFAWLLDAWQAGPNAAAYDLESLLQCPVYEDEIVTFITPLSHPNDSLASQIRTLLNQSRKNVDGEEFQGLPLAKDVDGEDWMFMSSENEMAKFDPASLASTDVHLNDRTNNVLDEMLDGVRTFLGGTSGVEGVTTSHDDRVSGSGPDVHPSINPTVFLNILHAVLQAEKADDIVFPDCSNRRPSGETYDPYFSTEDYDLLDPVEGQCPMHEVMEAMDHELKGAPSLSRALNGATHTLDGHVLSNFVESLEAAAGVSGPVSNLLGDLAGYVVP